MFLFITGNIKKPSIVSFICRYWIQFFYTKSFLNRISFSQRLYIIIYFVGRDSLWSVYVLILSRQNLRTHLFIDFQGATYSSATNMIAGATVPFIYETALTLDVVAIEVCSRWNSCPWLCKIDIFCCFHDKQGFDRRKTSSKPFLASYNPHLNSHFWQKRELTPSSICSKQQKIKCSLINKIVSRWRRERGANGRIHRLHSSLMQFMRSFFLAFNVPTQSKFTWLLTDLLPK